MRWFVAGVAVAAGLAAYIAFGRETPPAPAAYQGYVEGDFVYVSPLVSGRVDELPVERGMTVSVGQALLRLESGYETAALREAEREQAAARATLADLLTGKRPSEVAAVAAQLEQARAQLSDAEKQYNRQRELARRGAVSGAQFDNYQQARDTAAARVAELEAQLETARLPARDDRIAAQREEVAAAAARREQAAWTLARKRVESPRAGVIVDTLVRRGEWAGAGQPALKLLPPENVKIRFFVPEADVAGLALGQRVDVLRDGIDGALPARVDFISPEAEYTPPIIYSNETRSKLVFMAEARPVDASETSRLHPGQPVRVRPAAVGAGAAPVAPAAK